MDKIGYLKLGCVQGINHLLQPISYRLNTPFCKPVNILINMTRKCCLRCQHCDVWKRESEPFELSVEEKLHTLSRLRDWLGPFNMALVGEGEPLLCADELFRLIDYASHNQIRTHVTSNAVPVNRALAGRIVDSGLNSFTISLDGVRPETHDYVRGVPGTFEKVMKAVLLINPIRKSMLLYINTVIIEQNIDELTDLVRFVKEEGLDGISFSALQAPVESGNDIQWLDESVLWPRDIERVRTVIEQLKSMKMSGFPILNDIGALDAMKAHFEDPARLAVGPCYVGVMNFNVELNGDVKVCGSMPSIGNVRELSPKEIWASPRARKIRKMVQNCKLNCRVLGCYERKPFLHKALRFLGEVKRSHSSRVLETVQ